MRVGRGCPAMGCLACLIACAAWGQTEQGGGVTKVFSVNSEVTVYGGELRVFESIYLEGSEGRIYRDFDRPIRVHPASQDVVESQEPNGEGTRLRLVGEPLPGYPGRYTFELRYTTAAPVVFRPDGEELHWTVLTNRWDAPVDMVLSYLVLSNAEDGPIESVEAFIEGEGASPSAVEAQVVIPTRGSVSLNEALRPGETLRFVARLPKGAFNPETAVAVAASDDAVVGDETGGALQWSGSTGSLARVNLALALYFSIAATAFLLAASWVMFMKADEPGWKCIIPIYNVYVSLKIADAPGWWLVLYFIPGVSVVIALLHMLSLAKSFGKGVAFGLGLFFLGPIFLPILAFGDDVYEGAGWASASRAEV